MNQDQQKKFSRKRGAHGLGLFTKVPWKKGQDIIEYVGEIITGDEADRRGGRYLFEVSKKWTIDGKARTNLARYINHSCTPNCETEIRGKKVFVQAVKNIPADVELTYDYGKEYFNEFIAPIGCECPKHSKMKKAGVKTPLKKK